MFAKKYFPTKSAYLMNKLNEYLAHNGKYEKKQHNNFKLFMSCKSSKYAPGLHNLQKNCKGHVKFHQQNHKILSKNGLKINPYGVAITSKGLCENCKLHSANG